MEQTPETNIVESEDVSSLPLLRQRCGLPNETWNNHIYPFLNISALSCLARTSREFYAPTQRYLLQKKLISRCKMGKLSCVKNMIEKGARADIQGPNGVWPLSAAIWGLSKSVILYIESCLGDQAGAMWQHLSKKGMTEENLFQLDKPLEHTLPANDVTFRKLYRWYNKLESTPAAPDNSDWCTHEVCNKRMKHGAFYFYPPKDISNNYSVFSQNRQKQRRQYFSIPLFYFIFLDPAIKLREDGHGRNRTIRYASKYRRIPEREWQVYWKEKFESHKMPSFQIRVLIRGTHKIYDVWSLTLESIKQLLMDKRCWHGETLSQTQGLNNGL